MENSQTLLVPKSADDQPLSIVVDSPADDRASINPPVAQVASLVKEKSTGSNFVVSSFKGLKKKASRFLRIPRKKSTASSRDSIISTVGSTLTYSDSLLQPEESFMASNLSLSLPSATQIQVPQQPASEKATMDAEGSAQKEDVASNTATKGSETPRFSDSDDTGARVPPATGTNNPTISDNGQGTSTPVPTIVCTPPVQHSNLNIASSSSSPPPARKLFEYGKLGDPYDLDGFEDLFYKPTAEVDLKDYPRLDKLFTPSSSESEDGDQAEPKNGYHTV